MIEHNQKTQTDMELYDELYEKFGKPLEKEHWGEYLVISPQGQVLFGEICFEVVQKSSAQFGRGNFLYKIGERAVARFR